MKRIFVPSAICAAAVVAGSLAAGGTAVAAPAGSCPSGYDLVSVKFVVSQASSREAAQGIKAFDRNDNGLLCYKEVSAKLFDPTFLYYDDSFGTGTPANG
jgi:hypothetical protein